MNKRVQWRAVMLVTMATVAFGLSVRSYAADAPATTAAGPTIERYNPDVDGNRLVFTQVERQNGSTKRSVWSRDLLTGRETLVADVQTGEPYPVASAEFTAWSEGGPDAPRPAVVRARSTRPGSPVLEVFRTPDNGPFSGDEFLLSVGLDGRNLVTTNGVRPDGNAPRLVRFDLPSTSPRLLDVNENAFGISVGPPTVAQDDRYSVLSGSSSALFTVVERNGKVVAEPPSIVDGSFVCLHETRAPRSIAMSNGRVAMRDVCRTPPFGAYQSAIVTCVLPCTKVDTVSIAESSPSPVGPFSTDTTWLALDGDVAYWSTPLFGTSSIWSVNLRTGGPVRKVWTTSAAIGPRVSASNGRLAWDETGARDGVETHDVLVMTLATGTVKAVRANGADVAIPAATGPVRINPDVRGSTLTFAQVDRATGTTGIWRRSLSGNGATLLSTVASDGAVTRLGDRWAAWTVHDPSLPYDRVLATDGPGRPVVDVYTTDVTGAFGTPPTPVDIDLSGNRVVVSAVGLGEFFPGFSIVVPAVFSKALPDGPLAGEVVPDPAQPSWNPFGTPATEGGFTAVPVGGLGSGVMLIDAAGVSTVLRSPGPNCTMTHVDLTTTKLVSFETCFDVNGFASTRFASCTLPCASGFTDLLPVTDPTSGGQLIVTSLSASGTTAVVTASTPLLGGQDVRAANGTAVYVVDLTGVAPMRRLTMEVGTVSDVRIDGSTIVWSVDRFDGVRSGTIFVHDLRRGTTAKI